MRHFFHQLGFRYLYLCGNLGICLLGSGSTALGQVIPDTTLPNNTVVIPNANTSIIVEGTLVGKNLFHSFTEFSVPTGSTAFFNNPVEIQNILGRVTGGKISNIDGAIGANGTANLFLINPNGIVFGANAQLLLNGSFIASTASSIKFVDGSEFSAINPQAPPLLTINVPIGVQFGSNPKSIINRSIATSPVPLPPPLDPQTPVGLQVPPGQTLALIGGDLLLESGNLTAFQGNILLGSVASPGTVSLIPVGSTFTLGYLDIQNFGNIDLIGAAVNVSGLGGGTIQVTGGQVTLTQGSKLVAQTFGNLNGGGIDIQANQFRVQDGAFVSTSTFGSGAGGSLTVRADTVELSGTAPFATSQQLLTATFNPFNPSNGLFSLSVGSGTGGDITIDAGRLIVQNGANILTTTFVNGNGGNLTLRVSELAALSHGSLLLTGTAGDGNAGNVSITASELQVLDGTSISTTPSGLSTGRGGNLGVTAESVELRGTPAAAVVPGGLFTTTLGAGDAGDLSVTAGQLLVADGTQISTSTSGAGRGGNLTVTADAVELSGKSANGQFLGGLLASTSLLTVPGKPGDAPAGNLTVNTRRLSVRNGAQITAATGSEGAGGNLTVNASESVEVTGFATGVAPAVERVSFGIVGDGIVPSAIEANTSGAGQAGNLTINTRSFTVLQGAEVGVRSTGSGATGDLKVTANSILLNQQGAISATSILGKGGNIELQVLHDLVIRGASQISTRAGTEATGGGDGGNITINTGVFAVIETSSINAEAFQGSGGNIQITTRGFFLSPDSSISASSKLGVDGVVEINRLGVDPSQGLVELPENFTEPSDRIVTGCAVDTGSSFVITGRGGLPEDPTGTLRGRTLWRDLRLSSGSSTARAPGNRGTLNQGRIAQFERSAQNQQAKPLVEATGWIINANGQVELVAQASKGTHDAIRPTSANNCGEL